jgi:hypothetical protein
MVSLDDVLSALHVRETDALEHPDSAEHAAAHANDAAALAAHALARRGALALTLPPRDAEALRAALRASEPLFADSGGDAPLATQLDGGYALLEHRGGTALPAGLVTLADCAFAFLDGAGRALLRALSGAPELDTALHPCDVAHPLSLRLPVAQLDSLLKPPGAPCYRRLRKAGSPSLDNASTLRFYRCSARADSVPCTFCNMLTLVFAEQAGPEVSLHGSQAWTAPAPDTVLVFVGECLQLATGNMVGACGYRTALAATQRTSLVMSLDADPDAPLPLVFGRFWRCDTVGKFNVRAAALRTSEKEPATQRTVACSSAGLAARSIAASVLELPELAAAIVGALGDDFAGLAAAELVCVALRDAVAPHWRRLCLLRLVPPLDPSPDWFSHESAPDTNRLLVPELPLCIVASDARQWRALLHCVAKRSIWLRVMRGDVSAMLFKFPVRIRWGQIAAACCTKLGLDRALVHFSFNGRRILDSDKVFEVRLPHGATIQATVEQAGA